MIVHVGPSHLPLPARLGGAVERRMMELAEAQARTGERVIVYSGGPETGWREYRGVAIRYLAGSQPEFALRFVQDVVRRAPRVIHVHNRAEIAWLAKAAGLGPAVAQLRLSFRTMAAISRTCARSAKRFGGIVCWPATASRRFRTIAGGSIALIGICLTAGLRPFPNGVDCTRFRPDPVLRAHWRARLGVDGHPVILYVGRLCEQKGTDLLIACLPHVAATGGAGGSRACGAVRPDRNRHPGCPGPGTPAASICLPLDDADMPGIYNACDIFVMPTRELEMFGMAAVEAQACGKPVVASDHGGLRETVPETAGMRFRTGDAADLAARLEALLASPEWQALWAPAHAKMRRATTGRRIAERCQEVYATL